MTNRILIIGQAPSSDSDPAEPFSGASGKRLADLSGLTHREFLDTFDRVNLIPEYPGKGRGKGDLFPADRARDSALGMAAQVHGRKVILVGSRVGWAFRLMPPSFVWHKRFGAQMTIVPHPSGVSHWWNDPANVELARDFWTGIAAEALSLRAAA